jgi:hypothetical protein
LGVYSIHGGAFDRTIIEQRQRHPNSSIAESVLRDFKRRIQPDLLIAVRNWVDVAGNAAGSEVVRVSSVGQKRRS